jgi:hypothetical protein
MSHPDVYALASSTTLNHGRGMIVAKLVSLIGILGPNYSLRFSLSHQRNHHPFSSSLPFSRGVSLSTQVYCFRDFAKTFSCRAGWYFPRRNNPWTHALGLHQVRNPCGGSLAQSTAEPRWNRGLQC